MKRYLLICCVFALAHLQAATVKTSAAGPLHTLTVDITSLALDASSLHAVQTQCWMGTGFSGGEVTGVLSQLRITSIDALSTSSITIRVGDSGGPKSNVVCAVNGGASGGGGAPTGAAGGDLSGTYPNPGVAKVNGTTVAVNSAANQVALTTASAVTAWTGIPACLDSAGQHLNFDTTAHTFSCGTSGGSTSPGSPDKAVQIGIAGVFTGAPIHAATSAELAGVDIVTNGNFAGGLSGWTVDGDGTGWTIVGGHLHHTPGLANKISRAVTVTRYDTYLQQVQVVSQSAGTAYIDLGVDCNSDCGAVLAVGANPYDLVASSDNGLTVIEIQPDAASDITISAIGLLHGLPSLYLPSLGNSNIADGALTLHSMSGGYSNFAAGPFALFSSVAGRFDTAVGPSTLLSATGVGGSNTAIGFAALQGLTDGAGAIGIGRAAGTGLTTGAWSVFIGTDSSTTKPDVVNSVCIGGSSCAVSQDNQTVIGNSSTTRTDFFGILSAPQHTPASSSEPCSASQVAWDDLFFYECVVTNTWKRVALSSF